VLRRSSAARCSRQRAASPGLGELERLTRAGVPGSILRLELGGRDCFVGLGLSVAS